MSVQVHLSHLEGEGELEKVEVWMKRDGGVCKCRMGSSACGRLHATSEENRD